MNTFKTTQPKQKINKIPQLDKENENGGETTESV